MASCQPQGATFSQAEDNTDSITLRIALMPVMDCLPIYYAQRMGLMNERGIHSSLATYQAQMDVDTALLRGHADIAFSDLFRALRMESETSIRAILQSQGTYSLLMMRDSTLTDLLKMKERMIAISRLSATDYWCDALIDQNDFLTQEDIYRPQIHDVRLRSEMLYNKLLDAAILPEPYATWLEQEGHTRVFQSPTDSCLFGAWIIRNDSTLTDCLRNQIHAFMEVYQLSVAAINQAPQTDTLKTILREEYHLPSAFVDSLSIPQFASAVLPTSQDVERAVKWLKQRERLPEKCKSDSLLDPQYLTR